MQQAGKPELLEGVMAATIPMRGRMIHGKKATGECYEIAQDYDVNGQVRDASRFIQPPKKQFFWILLLALPFPL